MAKLRILQKKREELYEILDEKVSIGRAKDNMIRIKDPVSSRNHCYIEKVPEGYKLVDLESRNGTKVNGETKNQTILKSGDEIGIGDVKIIFEEDSSTSGQKAPAARKVSSSKVRAPSSIVVQKSSDTQLLVAGGVILIVILVAGLLFLIGQESEEDVQSEIAYQKFIDYYNKSKYKKALLESEKIKSSYLKKHPLVKKELKKRLEIIHAKLKDTTSFPPHKKNKKKDDIIFTSKAERELNKIAKKEEEGEDFETVLNEYWEFTKKYENSKIVKKAKKKIEKLIEDRYNKVLNESLRYQSEWKYKRAYDILYEFYNKVPLSIYGYGGFAKNKADEILNKISKQKFEEELRNVEEQLKIGKKENKERAKQILQKIIDNFGFQNYVNRAKNKLKEIK